MRRGPLCLRPLTYDIINSLTISLANEMMVMLINYYPIFDDGWISQMFALLNLSLGGSCLV